MENSLEQIESGIALIKQLIKKVKGRKNSTEDLKNSVNLLEKKLKMLKKEEVLRVQYLDRTAFDTIQGVFQAFHLYIVSNTDDALIQVVVDWLRSYESCYDIAERIQKSAEQRADFNAGTKTRK